MLISVKSFVFLLSSFFVSCRCSLCRFEHAQIKMSPGYLNDSLPAVAIGSFCYPFVTRGVVALRAAIAFIFGVRRFSEILPTYIFRFSVYVVDLIFGPPLSHKEVRDSMPKIHSAADANYQVSISAFTPRQFFGLAPRGAIYFPAYFPAFRVIRQYFIDKFVGQIVFWLGCHEAHYGRS